MIVSCTITNRRGADRREGSGVGSEETWHHGLVADWWAEFNTGGPEIDYFGQFVEDAQPALDAGCG